MPAGTALFGSSSRNQSKNLLEFKAGKMSMKGKTVYPDKRKGLVYIYQSEDSLMHFCWKDRSSGTVEDDLIIFPDDVEFKHIPQCTTGRVYLLKFKSSSRKFFFWVQEPKTEKDEENCRKVNEILNNPPALGSQRSGGATPDCDLQNLLSNMSQQQLMQLFGGVGQISGLSNLLSHINRPSSGSGSGGNGSTTTTTAGSGGTTTTASSGGTTSSPAATTGSATAASPVVPATPSTPVSSGPMAPPTPAAPTRGVSKAKVELSPTFLQSCLSRIQDPSTPTSTRTPQQTQVDLSTSMTTETLGAILNDAGLVRELERHLPALEGCQQDQLSSTLASPQFHQAVSMFSNALQSGQLGPVVSQFEVGDEAVSAASQGNMEEFVKALQAANISTSSTGGASRGSTPQSPNTGTTPQSEEKAKTTEKSPREDDDNMSLD